MKWNGKRMNVLSPQGLTIWMIGNNGMEWSEMEWSKGINPKK
jgi:hypothetical protein